MIQKLKNLLTKRDKSFLLGLLVFSIVISLIETAGISVIMPFIAVATDFSLIHTNEYYNANYMLFILHKGTHLPATESVQVETIVDYQTEIILDIYEGEYKDVRNNSFKGQFIMDHIARKKRRRHF